MHLQTSLGEGDQWPKAVTLLKPAGHFSCHLNPGWPDKKGTVELLNQHERKFATHFWSCVESVGGLEQGYWHCFADVTNGG